MILQSSLGQGSSVDIACELVFGAGSNVLVRLFLTRVRALYVALQQVLGEGNPVLIGGIGLIDDALARSKSHPDSRPAAEIFSMDDLNRLCFATAKAVELGEKNVNQGIVRAALDALQQAATLIETQLVVLEPGEDGAKPPTPKQSLFWPLLGIGAGVAALAGTVIYVTTRSRS